MARTHSQQFANETIARAVFDDVLAVTRPIVDGTGQAALAALWEQAGGEVAPMFRVPAPTFTVLAERVETYLVAVVVLPAPRESGDPVAIAIVGVGDGVRRLNTVSYYVLEVAIDARTSNTTFSVVSRASLDQPLPAGEGPLPDPRWFGAHAFELYWGRPPPVPAGVPELPSWYWWYDLDVVNAVRAFGSAEDDKDRIDAIRREPLLLLPEIADAAEIYVGAPVARQLRELRPTMRRSEACASIWQALVQRLTSRTGRTPAASTTRALPLIAEAHEHGALTTAQAYELEAVVRSKLAAQGVDADTNYAAAERLFAAARAEAGAPRVARGTAPPPVSREDPVWAPLFLDESELGRFARGPGDAASMSADPTFLAHGGLRAGYATWLADESTAIARLLDVRWVFRNAALASSFVQQYLALLGDGMPSLQVPLFGDENFAFGADQAQVGGGRRTHSIVVRVGRIVAKLLATEGAYAASSGHILHSALLHPLAARAAARARTALAEYWLAVAQPTNAVAALVHSQGLDVPNLIGTYPLLALPELPAAIATKEAAHQEAARALASYQAQLRGHRWPQYRAAMLALVRALLDSDMGDARVNAAKAHEIVMELGQLDPDPVWRQLDAECRARA